MRKARSIFGVLLCVGFVFVCAVSQKVPNQEETQGVEQNLFSEEVQGIVEEDLNQNESDEQEEEFSPEKQEMKNRENFFEVVDAQGIDHNLSENLFQRLSEDEIFQNGAMKMTGLVIDDIDGNGQTDMLVMVLDAKEPAYYGSGGLWFYMNEDEPYCFDDEECSFYGWYDAFWVDIDNDENVEIIFSAQGTGCGAVGDSYKAVFKYKDHSIEKMALPSDLEESYDQGLRVELIQEPEVDKYSAYCPYFGERIFFQGENFTEGDIPYEACIAGGNVRGYYNLCEAEYDGKKVLQASEYLHGEGGIVHDVATAQFLITWEKDGAPKVVKWWIEETGNNWANSHESRIDYEEGYYYYASQSDHYYLYRTKEDDSQFQCLAKIHPGNICVRDGEIYFVNLSDGQGIYRVKKDGTRMEKLCENGRHMQVSAEYVYFCSTYEAEYDRFGIVKEEPSEFEDGFLYRMKRDGTERELIATNVWQYVLSDGDSEVWYSGSIYYSKWADNKFAICRMDFNGQNEEELCQFDNRGRMIVYGASLYYVGDFYGEREQISRLNLWNGEVTTYKVPCYIDCCIYNGRLYALNEEIGTTGRKISIYQINLDGTDCKRIYEYSFTCELWEDGYLSDLYATKEGIFFRQYVSEEKGCQWFCLTQDDKNETWKAQIWENWEELPVIMPAQNIEYGELKSVKSVLKSTQGYAEYLLDDLEFQEYYWMDEEGEGYNSYGICLPQFNSKIAGYKKINQYFQNVYQEALKEKETFFNALDEEGRDSTINWYQLIGYDYIYIGEKYITVAKYEEGYQGGKRNWTLQEPVTFDRKNGEVMSLEKLLGMPEQEAVAKLTGSVYKYMEGSGRGTFLLKEDDELTEHYDTKQFFLFPEGVGIYYKRYAIDCGAAGDYMFIIQWEEVLENL